jgi:hypothetical protein
MGPLNIAGDRVNAGSAPSNLSEPVQTDPSSYASQPEARGILDPGGTATLRSFESCPAHA